MEQPAGRPGGGPGITPTDAELQAALAEMLPLAVATMERLQHSSNSRIATAAAAELAKARGLGLW